MRGLMNSWQTQHPAWRYRFWTDDDIEKLVQTHYPSMLPVFDALQLKIEKIDIARYLILHQCGGVYADVDMESLQPFDLLLSGQSIVLSKEPDTHTYREIGGAPVSNAFMAAEPRHPFLDYLIGQLRHLDPSSRDASKVLERTGPVRLTRALGRFDTEQSYRILDAKVTSPYPAHDWRLAFLLKDTANAGPRDELRSQGVYAIHYWFNTWAHTQVAGAADPHVAVEGYTFYPKRDSTDHDIFRRQGDLEALAHACTAQGGLGFNTAGVVKGYIRPMDEWAEWFGAADSEGLYVRNAFHFGGAKR